jgi:hypothetical protein
LEIIIQPKALRHSFASIYLGSRARAEYAFVPMADGDALEFPGLRLQVLETPGHANKSTLNVDAVAEAGILRAYKSIGKNHFRPMYAPRHAGAGGANMGHPSRTIDRSEETKFAVSIL